MSAVRLSTEPEFLSTIEYWEAQIRRNPLTASALAAAAGFLVGGGPRSKTGLLLMTYGLKFGLRHFATSLVSELIAPDGRPRSYTNAA